MITESPHSSAIKGIVNIGNTCYINAILQCLNSCSLFRDALLEMMSANSMQYNGTMAMEVSVLLKGLKEKKTIDPLRIVSMLSNKFYYSN